MDLKPEYFWKRKTPEESNLLDQFLSACSGGNLDTAKDIEKKVDIREVANTTFLLSCINGHMEICRWLYSLGYVNIHYYDDLFFRMSCVKNYLDIAKWLYSMSPMNIHYAREDTFVGVCGNGHLEVAKYLYSLGSCNQKLNRRWPSSFTTDDEPNFRGAISDAFRLACQNGHLDVVKWLYSIHKLDVMSGFLVASSQFKMEVALWLYFKQPERTTICGDFHRYLVEYRQTIVSMMLTEKGLEDIDKNLFRIISEYL